MRKEHQALLVAALAGLVIVGAAAFMGQPGLTGNTAPTQASLDQPLIAAGQSLSATRLG